MPSFSPLELVPTTGNLAVLRVAPAGQTVAPDKLPAALPDEQGAVELADQAPPAIGSQSVLGTGTDAAVGNHTHGHGSHTDPTNHAPATQQAAGFMSPTDKADHDAMVAAAPGNATAITNLGTALSLETTNRIAGDSTLASAITAVDSAAEHSANKGVANGYAPLDSSSPQPKIPSQFLPPAAIGGLLDGANAASTGANIPPEPELGVARDVTSQILNLRTIVGQLGLEATLVGESIRIRRRPTFWAPSSRSTSENYQPKFSPTRKTAGAAGENAASGPNYLPSFLLDNHGSTDHLFPYMVWTGVDSKGLVHFHHRRLRGTSLADTSTIKGYEFGHNVAAGRARTGQRFQWNLSGAVENVTWDDAFLDFALELNPTSGNFAGASLMRMLSPELGTHWSGERRWRARIELEVLGVDSCAFHGEWTLYSSTGAVLREWKRGNSLAGTHDWLTTAQRIQLRWRVDRDLATRSNVFDGLNQGERQGANLLRLHVDRHEYQPIGF